MRTRLILENDYSTTTWSGGITKEILIYPSDSKVENQDFIFRVSSATITKDSEFTKYSNYKRYLLTLNKSIELFHGEDGVTLEPLNIYEFDGSIDTSSKGECIDFNLIVEKEYPVMMEILEKGHYEIFDYNVFVLYATSNAEVSISGRKRIIKKGATLVIDDLDTINIKVLNDTKLIGCFIKIEADSSDS